MYTYQRLAALAQFIEDGSGDFLGSQNLCVGRAGASDGNELGYAITASNARSNFFLNNGSDAGTPTNNIGYQVYFNNAVQGVQQFGDGQELEHSIQNLNSFNTELAETECTGTTVNSTVWVKASGPQIAAAVPGTYTDTVTVTVAVN